MTRETTSFPSRQTMLAMFAAVAFFGAASVAQAQSTSSAPARTNPSATTTPGTNGTMRSGSASMNAQGSTAATGSPTQVNPNSPDSNREASQGMVPSTGQDSAQARIDAPDSNLRNDRTTMARAPRADRN